MGRRSEKIAQYTHFNIAKTAGIIAVFGITGLLTYSAVELIKASKRLGDIDIGKFGRIDPRG